MESVDLDDVSWNEIPDSNYIMKYKFSETNYIIIATNLSCTFGEKLNDTQIYERFLNLNPHVEIKASVVINNLKNSLEACIKSSSEFELNESSENLILRIQFVIAHSTFIYDIKMTLLEPNQIRDNLLTPAILIAKYYHQKYTELNKKMVEYEREKNSFSHTSFKINGEMNDKNIKEEHLNNKDIPRKELLKAFIEIHSFEDKLILNKVRNAFFPSNANNISTFKKSITNQKQSILTKKHGIESKEIDKKIKYQDKNEPVIKEEIQNYPQVVQTSLQLKVKKKKPIKF